MLRVWVLPFEVEEVVPAGEAALVRVLPDAPVVELREAAELEAVAPVRDGVVVRAGAGLRRRAVEDAGALRRGAVPPELRVVDTLYLRGELRSKRSIPQEFQMAGHVNFVLTCKQFVNGVSMIVFPPIYALNAFEPWFGA